MNRPAPNFERRSIRFRLCALAIVSLLAFAACNDGETTTTEAAPTTESSSPATTTSSPEEYVSTLCTEMQTWLTSLQEGQAEIQATVQPGASTEESQAALASFFDGAVAATEELVTSIQEAGAPDVEGGEEIAEELTSRFEEARTALEEARAEVDALPIDDPEAFRAAADELGASIQAQLQAIGAALSSLSQEELDQAAAADPTCTALSPTGG